MSSLTEGRRPPPPSDPPLYRCRVCLEGRGWIQTSDEGRGTVKPCPNCRSETHTLWVGGHFDAGHDCRRHKQTKRSA